MIFPATLCGWPESAGRAPQAASSQKTESASGERVVLTIGNQKMTADDVEKFIRALPPNLRAFYSGQGKRLLPASIARMKVLSAEAIKEKLDQQPEVALAIEIARESIQADAAQEHFEEGITVSDQELRDLYQKDKALSEEVRVRHILIQTEDAPLKSSILIHAPLSEPEARKKLEDIRKQILAGADFTQMAKQYSEDEATAASGGDMGVLQRDKVVPAIVNAANSLEPGQVSGILVTPSGLEIIQVVGKRAKPFEEVKPELEAKLRESKAATVIQHLTDEYHVVVDQEFFAGPPAKQGPGPSP